MAGKSTRNLLGDLEAPLTAASTGGNDDDKHEHYHPRTVQRITTRIQALTLELLPIQVDLEELTSPTSSILTPKVIDAYSKIAGDFSPCLPFALLEARRYFRQQQYLNPSDADENLGRRLACEAIARKLVARAEMREQYKLLSRRWTTVDDDGDETLPLSALESAVDQHATFFLSSNEAQRSVFALWKGLLVQTQTARGNIEYQLYKPPPSASSSFLAHWNPQRVAVPRYQYVFRIVLWLVFLVGFTIAIQTPERGFGLEDVVLYVQLMGYLLEDVTKIWKIGFSAAFTFWQAVNFCIYAITLVAFVYRCLDLSTSDPEKQAQYRMRAFQWLSSAAPLVWAKLLTVFDVFKFIGVLEIVVQRMLKESAIFVVLLSVLAAGFGQALTGLDVADEKRDSTNAVLNSLLQALLGSPNFDFYDTGASSYPFGLVLYYAWSVATIVILLNVLVALFSTSYSECVDESEPTFLAFFAGKTISSVRAPDQYVYPAPLNLIEALVLPLEFVLSAEAYAVLNRYLMGALMFIPISCIALWETQIDPLRASDLDDLLTERDEYQEAEEDPEPYRTSAPVSSTSGSLSATTASFLGSSSSGRGGNERHSSSSRAGKKDKLKKRAKGDGPGEGEFGHDGEPEGKKIARVKFSELKGMMPDLTQSTEGRTLALVLELSKEIKALREEVAELKQEKVNGKGKGNTSDPEKQAQYRMRAFRLEIVVQRMLKESAIFVALTGLDVADEKRDSTNAVLNSLHQALLGSPNFDFYDTGASSYPFGLVFFCVSTVATMVILNVLVALFAPPPVAPRATSGTTASCGEGDRALQA
ncbi:hypothetical protein JCM10207_007248 [Rhodosporidiobolus poonsookiae]